MNKVIGLLLVVVGGALLYQGFTRKDSLAGGAEAFGAKIANKVDGGTRVADHMYYIAGGTVLVLAGGVLVLRKSA